MNTGSFEFNALGPVLLNFFDYRIPLHCCHPCGEERPAKKLIGLSHPQTELKGNDEK